MKQRSLTGTLYVNRQACHGRSSAPSFHASTFKHAIRWKILGSAPRHIPLWLRTATHTKQAPRSLSMPFQAPPRIIIPAHCHALCCLRSHVTSLRNAASSPGPSQQAGSLPPVDVPLGEYPRQHYNEATSHLRLAAHAPARNTGSLRSRSQPPYHPADQQSARPPSRGSRSARLPTDPLPPPHQKVLRTTPPVHVMQQSLTLVAASRAQPPPNQNLFS
jgi:hypothetical protein